MKNKSCFREVLIGLFIAIVGGILVSILTDGCNDKVTKSGIPQSGNSDKAQVQEYSNESTQIIQGDYVVGDKSINYYDINEHKTNKQTNEYKLRPNNNKSKQFEAIVDVIDQRIKWSYEGGQEGILICLINHSNEIAYVSSEQKFILIENDTNEITKYSKLNQTLPQGTPIYPKAEHEEPLCIFHQAKLDEKDSVNDERSIFFYFRLVVKNRSNNNFANITKIFAWRGGQIDGDYWYLATNNEIKKVLTYLKGK